MRSYIITIIKGSEVARFRATAKSTSEAVNKVCKSTMTSPVNVYTVRKIK